MSIQNCIFCKIISKEIPVQFVKETDELIVLKDLYPKALSHYLIIPKKHVQDIQSLDVLDKSLVAEMVLMAKELAQDLEDNGDFRLQVNSGKDAGQEVFHLHFHVLSNKKSKK
ncbi:MAG: Protein kinase C inhibitor (HIT family) [candidate division TM6 bacterium GW2011_GWF2_32_72]|nr:MAG: Protein kinase C inhibitor (HIT family) [candidate division TM6 bacterium GW2011_GWF2_32_72]